MSYTIKIESESGRSVKPPCESFDVVNGNATSEPRVNPKIIMHAPEGEIEVMPGHIAYVMNQFGKNIEKVMGFDSDRFWAAQVERAALRRR